MSKRITRRSLIKLAGASSAAALLAACAPKAQPTQAPSSGGEQPTSPTSAPEAAPAETHKLIFSSYTWSGYEAAMRTVIDDWAAQNPGVEVEGQFIPEDYWTKIQTQVAGGTPPDVGIADYGRLLTYAKSGTLLAITEMVNRDSFPIDKMIPGALAQYRWAKGEFDTGGEGGELYGLPSDAQCQIFAYNKTMFDAAGVSYPTDDWTWDDLVAAGQAITNADENKWGMRMIDPWILAKGNFLFSTGGANHDAEFQKSMIDAPESIEAFKWDWDLVYTHKIAPPPGAQTEVNPFMSGQVAMIVDGVWWISDFASITDFEWDIALLPKHPKTGKFTTSVESDGWWIFNGTKEVDLSWSLMKSLADEDGQTHFGELNYIVPSSFPEVGEDWYSQSPPEHRHKAIDNIVADSVKVDYTYFEFFTVFDAYRPLIEAAFADGTDIEAACRDAAQVHNEELAAAWERFKA